MSQFRWRKLNKDEVIQHGDFVVEDCEFDMNLGREQLESWVKTHSWPSLPRLHHAFNWVGNWVGESPGLGVWPVWRIEAVMPEPSSEPMTAERRIQIEL